MFYMLQVEFYPHKILKDSDGKSYCPGFEFYGYKNYSDLQSRSMINLCKDLADGATPNSKVETVRSGMIWGIRSI